MTTPDFQAPQPAPVVVAPDANADEMNRLHGEAYGTDWVYPEQPDSFDVVLDESAADLLRQTIGDGEDAAPVRFQVGYGHSGHGLYVSLTEYPEEGANLIREMPRPAAPVVSRKAITTELIDAIARYCKSDSRDLAHAAIEKVLAAAPIPAPEGGPTLTDEQIDAIVTRHFRDKRHPDSYSALRETIRDALAAQPAPKLEDIEQYRLQMAGISTAALGYWKESDGILPDYDTVPLRDVAKLYAKYDKLFKEKVEAQANPPQPAVQAPAEGDGLSLDELRRLWAAATPLRMPELPPHELGAREVAFARSIEAANTQPKGAPAGWVIRDRSDLEPGAIDIEGNGHRRLILQPQLMGYPEQRMLYAMATSMLAVQAPAVGAGDAKDAARIQFLEDETNAGSAPNLVFDDDGHWAVSYSGMQPLPRGDGQGFDETVGIHVIVGPEEWRPSIREAIDAAMAAAEVQPPVQGSQP